jgi:hypothetical protein
MRRSAMTAGAAVVGILFMASSGFVESGKCRVANAAACFMPEIDASLLRDGPKVTRMGLSGIGR